MGRVAIAAFECVHGAGISTCVFKAGIRFSHYLVALHSVTTNVAALSAGKANLLTPSAIGLLQVQ